MRKNNLPKKKLSRKYLHKPGGSQTRSLTTIPDKGPSLIYKTRFDVGSEKYQERQVHRSENMANGEAVSSARKLLDYQSYASENRATKSAPALFDHTIPKADSKMDYVNSTIGSFNQQWLPIKQPEDLSTQISLVTDVVREDTKLKELRHALLNGPKKKAKFSAFPVSDIDRLISSRFFGLTADQPSSPTDFIVNPKSPLGPIVDRSSCSSSASQIGLLKTPEHSTTLSTDLSLEYENFDQIPCNAKNNNTAMHDLNHAIRSGHVSEDVLNTVDDVLPRAAVCSESTILAAELSSSDGIVDPNSNRTSLDDLSHSKTMEEVVVSCLEKLDVESHTTYKRKTSLNEKLEDAHGSPTAKCLERQNAVDSSKIPKVVNKGASTDRVEVSAAETQTERMDASTVAIQTEPQNQAVWHTEVNCPAKIIKTRTVSTQTEPIDYPDHKCFLGNEYEIVLRDYGRILYRRITTEKELDFREVLHASFNISGLFPTPPKGVSPRNVLFDNKSTKRRVSEQPKTTVAALPAKSMHRKPTRPKRSSLKFNEHKPKTPKAKTNTVRERKSEMPRREKVEENSEDHDKSTILEQLRALFVRIRSRPKKDFDCL